MMFGLLRKMKRKIIVLEALVFFSPVTLEINGGN